MRNNIAALRKYRGLSQSQLAEKVGTTLNMLGKLERGERKLDLRWLQRIATGLQVEPSELIIPSGMIEPPPGAPDFADERVETSQSSKALIFRYFLDRHGLGTDDDEIEFNREALHGMSVRSDEAMVILLGQIDRRLSDIVSFLHEARENEQDR